MTSFSAGQPVQGWRGWPGVVADAAEGQVRVWWLGEDGAGDWQPAGEVAPLDPGSRWFGQYTVPAEWRARLGLPAEPAPAARDARVGMPSYEQVGERLGAMTSREDAYDLLRGYTVTELRDLAATLGVTIASPDRRKADVLASLVHSTVGARLGSAAVRGTPAPGGGDERRRRSPQASPAPAAEAAPASTAPPPPPSAGPGPSPARAAPVAAPAATATPSGEVTTIGAHRAFLAEVSSHLAEVVSRVEQAQARADAQQVPQAVLGALARCRRPCRRPRPRPAPRPPRWTACWAPLRRP